MSLAITEKYISRYLSKLGDVKSLQGVKHTFACPLCSPYKKTESKKKNKCAGLFFDKTRCTYTFKCFYCEKKRGLRPMLFWNLLQIDDHNLFNQYHREMDMNGNTGKGHNLPKYQYLEPKQPFPKKSL